MACWAPPAWCCCCLPWPPASAGNAATIALAILVVAALGGFYLLSFHIRKERHPKAVIVVHALIAVAGFLTLLYTILQQQSA